MDRFEIPRAYMHYRVQSAHIPEHPETTMFINRIYMTVLLNLDAEPDANVIRVVMRR